MQLTNQCHIYLCVGFYLSSFGFLVVLQTEHSNFSSALVNDELLPFPIWVFPFYCILLKYYFIYIVCVLVTQSCPMLCDTMDCQPPRLLCSWDSPGKNAGVSSHALLQGDFLIQGLDLGLQHCRQILYHLSHQGSPHFLYISTCHFTVCIF